ncbi:MAG: MFS transporter [Thermoanaerobaculales bacterium]|nr:MFS transporter [Thermoanaerobaculales bacterium]
MTHDIEKPTGPRAPLWVMSTYFAEGFPFGLIRLLSTAFFKDHGASLQAIGLTSLFGLPWTVKFLWAPFVDAFATKRRWLLLAEAALALMTAVLAFSTVLSSSLQVAAVIFLLLAFLSATHDIAIDGFYLEHLDRTEQARWVGFQAMSYRLALISSGGGIAWIAGEFSWRVGYLVGAVTLGLLFFFHSAFLPKTEESKRPMGELARWAIRPRTLMVVVAAALAGTALRRLLSLDALAPTVEILNRISLPSWIVIGLLTVLIALAARAPQLKTRLYASNSPYALAFVDYLAQEKIAVILGFIVTFRLGEAMLQNMAYPFLKDIGISLAQYGLAHNTYGLIASILGGLAGGAAIARWGLKRCIWPFVLALNSLNLLYMLMAWKYSYILADPQAGRASFALVATLLSAESFGAGLGTAAFMVFIMRTTQSEHKAAHMAIATGLMNVAGTLAGVVSGFLAAALGFVGYFGITVVATLPCMALIPFLPYLDGKRNEG